MNRKLVIGLTGMPGAGKSLVVSVAKEDGFGIVVMGDVVREEAKKKGLELTPENLGKTMLELRRREGNNIIAKRSILKIEEAEENKILVDGIRSLDEVNEFIRHFRRFTLIAVHSSPETRFRRVFNRRRSDDPRNWRIFDTRDTRELSVGLGNAIAMAEHVIINEGEREIVEKRIRLVLNRVERKWMT